MGCVMFIVKVKYVLWLHKTISNANVSGVSKGYRPLP